MGVKYALVIRQLSFGAWVQLFVKPIMDPRGSVAVGRVIGNDWCNLIQQRN